MLMIRFSILVVCLNPGEKLIKTVDSVLQQNYSDYEILVKDGGSKDGSMEALQTYISGDAYKESHVKILVKPDKSIYDAMNQAVDLARGEFVLFLNCGDYFHHPQVLEKVSQIIQAARDQETIFYGDTFYERSQAVVSAPSEITGFTCFRNIPCHQSCFYHRSLFREKKYNCDYKIRADYDHFLWCFFEKQVKPYYVGFPIATYEGGGYSENKENEKRDKAEHEAIIRTYMSLGQLSVYKAAMILSLQPFRKAMAESKTFGKLYEGIKSRIYRR